MVLDYRRLLTHPLFLSGLVGIGAILAMYAWVPYGMGYGSVPGSVLANLWLMWMHTPEWEHCQLVPVISLCLIYWQREEVLGRQIDFQSIDFIVIAGSSAAFLIACFNDVNYVAIPALFVLIYQVFLGANRFSGVVTKGDNWAGGLLLVAMLVYWIGYKIDVVQVSFLSLHFTIGVLLLWFFGWKFFRVIAFAYLFLVFAWPMPFLDMVAFKLRVLMSAISHIFLNLIGVDAIRVGTAIVSAPDFASNIPQGARFSLDVADPCSGIRSLFALTMVTALLAYFTQDKIWKQWLLFACAVPLAVAGNFVRILMLTFGTILFGSETAIGTATHPSTYHMVSGFVVFIVALGGALAIGWLLGDGWKVVAAVLGLNNIKLSDLKKAPEPRNEY